MTRYLNRAQEKLLQAHCQVQGEKPAESFAQAIVRVPFGILNHQTVLLTTKDVVSRNEIKTQHNQLNNKLSLS